MDGPYPGDRVEPLSDLEREIAAIWSDVLGTGSIGIDDSVYELGADATMAAEAHRRIQDMLVVRWMGAGASAPPALAARLAEQVRALAEQEFPLRAVVDSPTVRLLAASISGGGDEASRPPDGEHDGGVESGPRTITAAPAIATAPATYPVSRAQRRIWLLHRLDPTGSAYNVVYLLNAAGPLDAPALERAFRTLVERHEALRTTIVEQDGELRQRIQPAADLAWTVADLSSLPENVRQARLRERLLHAAREPFDLEHGPLVRAELVRLGENEHRLVLGMHHLVVDGRSWEVMYDELAAAYHATHAGAAPVFAPQPVRYVEYAAWQNERIAEGRLARSEEYWCRRFADGIPELALPVDHANPSARTFQRHRQIAVFDRDTAERLRALGRQLKATPFIVHLAVLTAFLRRITGQDDLVVGIPVAGRDRPDVDRVVGCFINTVLLRVRVAGDPRIEDLVSAVRAEAIDAYEHQEYPVDLLAQKLAAGRDAERASLVQVLFANAAPQRPRAAGGVEFSVPTAATIVDPSGEVSLPLKFDFHAGAMDELDGRLTWVLGFSGDLFEADTARRLTRRFEAFVRDLAHRPTAKLSTLAILPPDEADALRLRRAEGRTVYPPSFNQREMWVQCQLQQGEGLNNIGVEVAMTGPLDVKAFEEALQIVVDRHEALRTMFEAPDGHPVQRVEPVRARVAAKDISHLPPERQQAFTAARREELVRTSFALDRAPLFRAELLRIGDDRSAFIFVVHHLVLDAFHLPLFLEELARVYHRRGAGSRDALGSPPLQYGDFAIWKEQVFKAGLLSQHQHYWQAQLRLPLPAMSIPADRQPAAGRTFDSGCVVRRLPSQVTAALKKLERRYRTTVFRTIVAAFDVWLWRMTGETDLLVAMPFSTRPNELREAIGFFGNTLPLRTVLDVDRPFHELLGRVTDQLREARDHRDFPLTEALGRLDLPRDPNRPALPICLSQIRQFAANAGDLEMKANFPFTRGSAFDLWLAVAEDGEGVELELIYATELFSEASVERWAGAMVALLAAAAADPEAPIGELRLVTADDEHALREWSDGGAGVAETDNAAAAFAAIASRRPDAIALHAGETSWTYGELQRAARSVSHALRSAGVARESRVGIIGTRSPGMLASVIGVLDAGAAFVPLEASQPDTRLQTIVVSAGVGAVMSDRESFGRAKSLVAGITPVVRVFCWDDAAATDASPELTPVVGGPTDLAYIFYTSGSTGVPKGAMVEQRGMSNHLRAKIATLGLDAGSVVAQTASYGFDIVVWQWLAPLLAGGRVVIYDDETAYDPAGLLRAMARDGVTVVETVPSFLDAMSAVEEAPALPALRWMVSNAEALPPAVAVRWRTRYPGVRLLNTCGATECSDDTTHGEVLLSSADTAVRVSVGQPIPGATASIVDETLRPLPPGCVGEIVYGGTAVGRGYLGDPIATARAFVPDPCSDVPGARLYRTGDRGRWRPDGELECLGRMDDQVKVYGYRVELGEVEAALAMLPGLSQVAAAVRTDTRGQRRLVAYYAGAAPDDEPAMRAALAARLPPYMVPTAFVRLPALPRTRTGKLDRAALPAPTAIDVAVAPEAAATPVETVVAAVWQQVLQVPFVGRHDNFFDLGGDSIQSILVAARLGQQGVRIAPRAVFAHPTIAELARVAEQSGQVRIGDGGPSHPAPLLPIQRSFFDRQIEDPHHWNQAAMIAPNTSDERVLREALQAIVVRHPALRMRFVERDGEMFQQPAPPGDPVAFEVMDLDESGDSMPSAATRVQQSLDLERGPVFRAALMRARGAPDRLLIVAHHLVIDTVSWGVLLDDLGQASAQLAAGEPLDLVPESTTYVEWVEALSRTSDRFEAELPYWQSIVARSTPVPRDRDAGPNTVGSAERVRASLASGLTRRLLTGARRRLQADITDLLLCAFARAAGAWTGSGDIAVYLEGHGREDLVAGADLGRTIGWFTAAYPVCLDTRAADVSAHITQVRDTRRQIPHRGIGYGFLRWGSRTLDASRGPDISFNYHGQIGRLVTSEHLTLTRESPGDAMSPRSTRPVLLNVECRVVDGQLEVECLYSTNVHSPDTIARLVDGFVDELAGLAALCDDTLLPANAEEVYPLAPIQEGMLFHALFEPESSLYYEQAQVVLEGALNVDALQSAWNQVLVAHRILRSVIRWEGFQDPVQVVLAPSPAPIRVVDLRHLSLAEQEARLARDADEQWTERFSLDRGPLVRLSLFALGPERHTVVWNFHHILLDGWSVTTLLRDLARAYEAALDRKPAVLTHARPYRDFVTWLRQQDRAAALDFWRNHLAGVDAPTPLPRDRARPAVRHREVAHVDLAVPPDLAASLDRWARGERVTTSALLRAAWAVLLARTSGTNDVVFGATVSGRPAALGGVERMVGPFINAVPVRVVVDADETIAALVARVHQQSVEAGAYEYLPLPDVQKACGIPGDRPLFDSLFAYENYPSEGRPRTMGGVRLRGGQARELTHYDLTLLADSSDTLRGRLAYATDVFEHATVTRLVDAFVNLLRAIAAAPHVRLSQLSFMSAEDEATLTARSGSRAEYAGRPDDPVTVDGTAPLTTLEAAIAGVWQSVLQVPHVRRRDTFFDLGGHSLTAIRIVSALKERLGRQVPIWQLFRTPALEDFARAVEHAAAETAPELARVGDRPWYPVSAAQRAQWIVGQLTAAHDSHPPRVLHLEGDLDRGALAAASQELIDRHEVLRTTFEERDGDVVQIVHDRMEATVAYDDLADVSDEARTTQLREILQAESRRPFTLSRLPLFELRVVRVAPRGHVVLLRVPHIISDGWTEGILAADLAASYSARRSGRRASLPPLRVRYVDVSASEKEWLAGAALQSQKAYWIARFSDEVPVLRLPVDPLAAEAKGHRLHHATTIVDEETIAALRATATAHGATLFAALLSAFDVLLARLSGQSDIVVGTTVAGRGRPELERVAGVFANMLPLRTSLAGNPSFADALRRVSETTLAAMARQDYPFQLWIDELRRRRRDRDLRLFSAFFVVHEEAFSPAFDGLTARWIGSDALGNTFDANSTPWDQRQHIALAANQTSGGWRIAVLGAPTVFTQRGLERLLQQWIAIVRQVSADPQRRLEEIELPLTPDVGGASFATVSLEQDELDRLFA